MPWLFVRYEVCVAPQLVLEPIKAEILSWGHLDQLGMEDVCLFPGQEKFMDTLLSVDNPEMSMISKADSRPIDNTWAGYKFLPR